MKYLLIMMWVFNTNIHTNDKHPVHGDYYQIEWPLVTRQYQFGDDQQYDVPLDA